MREPVAAAALRAGELARAGGAQVSLDLSSSTLIDDAFRARARAHAPHHVLAGERVRAANADGALGDLTARWIVKRGADGVVADGVAFPAVPTEVVDATGAGDAFAAGFLVGGVETGLRAAARCCAQLGAMP
jgi:sugar/nucleoside kinase (ribokinase family)